MNTRLISVLISGLFLVACQKEAPNSPASTENKTSSTAVETGMISPQVDVAPRPAFNANWKTYTFATEPNYPPLEYRNKNTEIIVVNSSAHTKSTEEELVEDLIQIVTVFSCKLQGKRSKQTKTMIAQLKVNA